MKSKRNFVSSLNKWFSPSEKRDFRSKKVRFEDRVSKSRREFYLNFRSWKKFNIEKAVLFPRFYFNFFHRRVIFFFFTFWPLEIRVRKLIKKKRKKCWIRKGEAKWMEKRKRSGNNAKESRRWSGEGHRISAFRPEITNSYSIEFLSFFIVSIYVCASSLLHYHYSLFSLSPTMDKIDAIHLLL